MIKWQEESLPESFSSSSQKISRYLETPNDWQPELLVQSPEESPVLQIAPKKIQFLKTGEQRSDAELRDLVSTILKEMGL